MAKSFKLIVHQKTFCGEDLIINGKDYPGAREGDVVEIYHDEDVGPRLLLQITTFREDLPSRDSISVEQSIATTFQLRTYALVSVKLVQPSDVALESVELTFKDQYMGRSEMWRLKNSLVNTCVYMNKKLEFCMGAIRCQVYEMWSQGDRVACGVITEDTKVVFRSSTSMVYLFLQMSSEMWDFDIHGDLYFEKAVNGFLADLFTKWKKHGSNHEVTIVLFSRTFYKANNLEEFPEYMRECLQLDYRGRYYEDFYRVAIQNERYDDWSHVLVQLRRLFSDYQKLVLHYHDRVGVSIPLATNSTAAQGNFLEVLNMSLNVFEKHYLERSLDRTGQLSVVITPGVGVFEVDRELTNVTKQRIIDNGVGSDLVCVGEQPLHAVPLLKFHNKDTSVSAADDYSMPHWINLSFYSSNKKVAYSNFIPRIKLPPRLPSNYSNGMNVVTNKKLLKDDEYIHNSFFDYDAYDAQVFQLPPVHGTSSLQRITQRATKKNSTSSEVGRDNFTTKHLQRKMSDPDIHHSNDSPKMHSLNMVPNRSQAISIPISSYESSDSPPVSPISEEPELNTGKYNIVTESLDNKLSPPCRAVVGSAGSPPPVISTVGLRPGRALINPFDPSHVTIKLTSNRRRWTHIFPKGPTGVLIQQHHYQAVPTQSSSNHSNSSVDLEIPGSPLTIHGFNSMSRSASQAALHESNKKRSSILHTAAGHNVTVAPSKSLTLLWGATGEQEWTPALTTVNEVLIGVDWKSLTIPACLPITTDYFPDKRALQNDYVLSNYDLLPDDVNADAAQQRAFCKKPLTTKEVFRELVSQRLAQGFQLIVLPESNGAPITSNCKGCPSQTGSCVVASRTMEIEHREEYLLSIGRVFHKISLSGNAITVTRYRPRHPYPPFNIHYRYRFHAPYHKTYEVSWVSFTTEKLENYNWNYLDHYICLRGHYLDTDFPVENFVDNLKFWRFRLYLMPLNHSATKRILDSKSDPSSPQTHMDIYTPHSVADQAAHVEGFLRFVEAFVNKIKRPNSYKKPRASMVAVSSGSTSSATQTHLQRRYSMSVVSSSSLQTNAGGNSPFRERVGSNRLPERPRPRSSSKVIERGRTSPATVTVPISADANSTVEETEDGQTSIQSLKSTSTLPEILEVMRHPISGVGFLMKHSNLPSLTFVSADAVNWLIINLEGVNTIEQAVSIMRSMLQQQFICHASGDPSKAFIFGFYLYYIVDQDKDSSDYLPPLTDLQTFENEWLEVEVREPRGWGGPDASHREAGVPHFLCDTIQTSYLQGDADNDTPLYNHIHLEIDVTNKSDRVEWGHARYQTVYRPDQAYELVVQWVTSSGAIVSELIFGWARKAQMNGLLMVPIPVDLLALPYAHKSDPLRGPIFIPLDTDCLMKNKDYLFEEFKEDTWADRLFLFQESIIAKFGFMACSVETTAPTTDKTVIHDHQYVHCSGNVFILIPSPPAFRPRQRITSINQKRANTRYPVLSEALSSPHHAYITRHVSGKNKDDFDNNRKMGFLWSWNHMVSRRWLSSSTPATGNDTFQRQMLKDFREFCSNVDGRLRLYWEQCWELKENASTKKV